MPPGRGRPRHPDVLTPAEWRVTEQVREGLTNSEVADRLGISINTVRFHVSNILGKLELDSRDALRQWTGAPRRPRRWGAMSLAGLGAAGASAAFILAVVFARATETREPACIEGLPPGSDYRVYEAGDLVALGMVDLGPLFSPVGGGGTIACTALREGMSGVRFSADVAVGPLFPLALPDGSSAMATLLPVEGAGRGQVSSELAGITQITHTSDSGETRIETAPHSEGSLPEVVLRVTRVDDPRPLPAAIDRDGRLWVDLGEGDHVTSGTTGAALDVGSAAWQARVIESRAGYAGGWWNSCTAGEPCSTTFVAAGLVAPERVRLVCVSPREARLETEVWMLRLLAVGGGVLGEACDGPGVLNLDAGARVELAGYINVSGYVDGQQVSVTSDTSDILYIGIEPPTIGCPCLRGQ